MELAIVEILVSKFTTVETWSERWWKIVYAWKCKSTKRDTSVVQLYTLRTATFVNFTRHFSEVFSFQNSYTMLCKQRLVQQLKAFCWKILSIDCSVKRVFYHRTQNGLTNNCLKTMLQFNKKMLRLWGINRKTSNFLFFTLGYANWNLR